MRASSASNNDGRTPRGEIVRTHPGDAVPRVPQSIGRCNGGAWPSDVSSDAARVGRHGRSTGLGFGSRTVATRAALVLQTGPAGSHLVKAETAAELDLEFPPVGGRVSSRFLSVRFDRAG